MKKILILSLVTLTSCWKTLPDGRQYRISCDCVSGHNEVRMTLMTTVNPNGTLNQIPTTETVYICDYSVCDTVWRKK